jgi:AraC-like DNA-binding protein
MITDRGYISAQLFRPLLLNQQTRTMLLDLWVTNERASRSDISTLVEHIGMIEEEKVEQLLSTLSTSSTLSNICVAPVSLFNASESSALHRLFLCSNSLREGLGYLERFSLLLAEAMETWLSRDDDDAIKVNIRFSGQMAEPEHHRMTLELIISTLLSWFSHLCGESVKVQRVTLPVPEPECTRHYEGSWGVPVEHDDHQCSIYLREEEVDHHLHKTNPLVTECVLTEVENLLLKQVRAGSLSIHIYQALMNGHLDMDVGQQEVAAFYRISPRTLNRHLQQESTTLKQLVTRVRIEKGKEWLLDNSLSIDEVARRVGLSGRRTLDRIFIKYEKLSPAQYRQRMLKTSGDAQ